MTHAYAQLDLAGRVALITGGGTGIGREIARLLAARGADLVLAARRADRLEEAAELIRGESGRKVSIHSADVTDPEAARAMIEAAAGDFGRIDLLINNAGRGTHAPLRTMDPAVWQKDVALNLNAAFYCSQAAYPHLKAAGKSASSD